jgi:hypothetical protein
MTRTTPFRLISLHLSQIRRTLARTFMIPSAPRLNAGKKVAKPGKTPAYRPPKNRQVRHAISRAGGGRATVPP